MQKNKKIKNILFLSLFLLIKNLAFSQITRGNWMLGGNISYSSTSLNSENFGPPHKNNILKINPNVGYFLIDKLAAGIKAGINKEGIKRNNYTDFNIGPFIRYYLLNEEKSINIISEAMYQYGFLGSLNSSNTHTSKNTFSFSAGPVVYFNTTVGLEFLLSYSSYKFVGIKGSNNTIMVGLGLQVHLEKE